jgi:biotin carboxyl carrier protein
VTSQYEAEVNGRLRHVSVRRENGRFVVTIDGQTWHVDAARVDVHTLSLLVSEETRLPQEEIQFKPERIRLKPDPTGNFAGADNLPVGSGFSRTFRRTRSYDVTVTPDAGAVQFAVRVGPVVVPVALNGRRHSRRKEEGGQSGAGPERLVAPMPGRVVRVLVKRGQAVTARQPIVVIEAMKMENELRAGREGMVSELQVNDGESVEAGALVAVITAATG